MIVAISAVMAFVVMRNFDEVAVAGPDYVVFISRSDGTSGADRVAQMVTAFAHEHTTNVGRLAADAHEPESRRHVYLAVGDEAAPSTALLTHGFPNFSRDAKTDMHPYTAMPDIGPTGYYLVYGPEGTANELLQEFQTLGFGGRVDPTFSWGHAFDYFGRGALLWCVLIVALIAMVTVGVGVILNAKAYGIQRLQGASWITVFGRDLLQLAKFCPGPLAVLALLNAGLLYLYNGLHQAMTYAMVTGGFLAFFVTVALASHLLALFLLYRSEILGAIKGEISADWGLTAAYGVRFTAAGLALAIGLAVVGDLVAYQNNRADLAAWSTRDQSYYMEIGGYGQAETRDVEKALGGWIRTLDGQDQVIVARYLPLMPRPGFHESSQRLDVLLVNDAYLGSNELVDVNGRRFTFTDADRAAVRILLPQRMRAKAAQITDRVTARILGSPARGPGRTPPPVRVSELRDGQRAFTYESWFNGYPLVMDDPVVVVVSGRSNVIRDEDYAAYATTGEIVFLDPDAVAASLRATGQQRYVLGFYLKAQQAADRHRSVSREFTMQLFNLVCALVVLLGTAVCVSIVYGRKNAQVIFVKHISGWSHLSIFWRVVLVEAGMAAFLVGYAWRSSASHLAELTDPRLLPKEYFEDAAVRLEPIAAVAVALLGLTLVLGALAYTHSRMVKAHSSSLA
ncbi:MAG: hypothetical protein JXA67_19720 [Micromonosporaceae bacterium]|nr:hypothetical protein [Micromonosporaceae bacterium]